MRSAHVWMLDSFDSKCNDTVKNKNSKQQQQKKIIELNKNENETTKKRAEASLDTWEEQWEEKKNHIRNEIGEKHVNKMACIFPISGVVHIVCSAASIWCMLCHFLYAFFSCLLLLTNAGTGLVLACGFMHFTCVYIVWLGECLFSLSFGLGRRHRRNKWKRSFSLWKSFWIYTTPYTLSHTAHGEERCIYLVGFVIAATQSL